MKELIAAIDILANNLEEVGYIKKALQMDVYSNTLEFIEKEAFNLNPFKSKKQPVDKANRPKLETVPPQRGNHKPTNYRPPSSGAAEEEKLTSKIREEAKSVLKYLDRYIFLRKNPEGAKTELDELGPDFHKKIMSVMTNLRKDLIGSKMFLNKLENVHGGLS